MSKLYVHFRVRAIYRDTLSSLRYNLYHEIANERKIGTMSIMINNQEEKVSLLIISFNTRPEEIAADLQVSCSCSLLIDNKIKVSQVRVDLRHSRSGDPRDDRLRNGERRLKDSLGRLESHKSHQVLHRVL